MPDYGFGRCDGHHEMVDFRLRKKRPPAPGYDSSSLQSPLPNSIYLHMWQRTLPAAYIAPCLPTKLQSCRPAANGCTIKHDGFRIMPGGTARECGSIVARATTSPAASR